MLNNAELLAKWQPILEAEGVPAITSMERTLVTAQLLENAEVATARGLIESVEHPLMNLHEAAPSNNTSGVQNYDPVMISLLRRAAPKLIAYDLVGVQAMTGPSGQIFYMRSHYGNTGGPEAQFNEANTGFSTVRGGNTSILGDATLNVGTSPTGNVATYNFAGAMALAQAEALGSTGNVAWREMAMTIDKFTVNAGSRKLKSEYTHEFAQDLKAIHGLDAVRELSNILSTELVSEINREVIRSVYGVAKIGSPNTQVAGMINLDVDTNGRWMGERFAGLHMLIEMEQNIQAKTTRRGRGNIILCSSNVASALRAAKLLNVTDAARLQIDDSGNTFAGTMGTSKVFIDPYATSDFLVVGYKGSSAWDAGLYYCPYTPLQQVKSLTQDTLTPIIGFQTRYAIAQNPFAGGATPIADGKLTPNSNEFYRLSAVQNIM
jgi:hypothetical protein